MISRAPEIEVILKFADRNPQTRIDSFFVTYEDKRLATRIESQRLKRSVEQAVGSPTRPPPQEQMQGKAVAIPARAKAGKGSKGSKKQKVK